MRIFALILLIINAIAMLVLYGFFVVGLGDGAVATSNIGLWLLILAGFTAVVTAGWVMRAKGRHGVATMLLLPLAVPVAFYGLFALFAIILQPRWN